MDMCPFPFMGSGLGLTHYWIRTNFNLGVNNFILKHIHILYLLISFYPVYLLICLLL